MFSWRIFHMDDKTYLFKITKTSNEDIIEFKLSDFIAMWTERLSHIEILARSKHENPRIESTYDQILTAIVSSINKSQFNNTNEVAIFRMKGYISDVPFKFHLNFVQSKQDAFLDQITKPLLLALIDAQLQKSDLLDVIRRKDAEILQYKIEGATLMRRHVATTAFDEDQFSAKHTRGNSDFSLVDLLRDKNHEKSLYQICGIDGNSFHRPTNSDKVTNGNGLTSKEIVKPSTLVSPRRGKRNKLQLGRKFQGKNGVKLVYDEHQSSEDDNNHTKSHCPSNDTACPTVDTACTTVACPTPNKKPRIRKLNL